MAQLTFERVEKKYLVTPAQLTVLWDILERYMEVDGYGRHTICNIYYDTGDYRLIRTSLDKPLYKEKLRLRSYGVPGADDQVFVELKKKYDGVVYKRRAALPLDTATAWLDGRIRIPQNQILREIDYFMEYYRPQPRVFLAYDRVALFGREDEALRLTLDGNIRWRTTRLDLAAGDEGSPLSVQGLYLMEIKLPGVMPLWLAHTLAELGISPVSFSKYGCCYREALCRRPVLYTARQPKKIRREQYAG